MTRTHGVTSLMWVAIAIGIAVWTLAQTALVWAGGYVLLCVAGAVVIIYAYCAKCPCKACCAHVLPGKVAARVSRVPAPYSDAEQAVVVVALLLILGLPQLWIWQRLAAGVGFWGLNGVAILQILGVICTTCPNTYCPIGKARRRLG